MTQPFVRPLSELDQVNWGSLTHAYGEADDVPEQLRQIAAGDEGAFSDLYGNLWHQGTVYQATSFAVPFLIGLLEAGNTELLNWLSCAAGGLSYHDVHQIYDDPAEVQTPEYQARVSDELHWVKAAREAVVAGADSYRLFLTAESPETRGMAAYLFSVLGKDCPQAAGWLAGGLTDPDVVARAACAWALWTFEPEITARLSLEFILNDLEPLPSLTAALTLAFWQGPQTGTAATQILLSAIANPDLGDLYGQLPWDSSEPMPQEALAAAARCLGQPELFARAFLDRFRQTAYDDELEYALLLAQPLESGAVTPVLRSVLDCFLACSDARLAGWQRWLTELNMPGTRAAISAFLQEQS